MEIQPADRLSQFSEYYFSSKLRTIAAYRDQGRDIINLGIGSPDLAPDQLIIDELTSSSKGDTSHGYQPYQGISGLQYAIRRFYNTHYSRTVDTLQVLPLLGSKEGITHISLAYLNPGDQVLIPSLAYPTYTSVTKMVGAEPIYFPLIAPSWEPDWEYLEDLDTSRVKILWINYPHMPTGTNASAELLEKFVDFAKRKNMLLCHDNPYSFILNDNPLSIFDIAGADEHCIELSSLSKTFNMAGWRVGWILGREELVKPVLTIKSNMDSGMFKPIQLAAIKALELKSDWLTNLNITYKKRQDVGLRILKALKCSVRPDQTGMFLWGKTSGGDGERLVEDLLENKDVFLAPGMIFGKQGTGYVRLSLCASEELLEEALTRIS